MDAIEQQQHRKPFVNAFKFASSMALALLAAACGGSDSNVDAGVKAAWVAIGSNNQAIVRVITSDAGCPDVRDGSSYVAMTVRAAAATVAQRPTASAAADSKPSAFPVTACEYLVPADSSGVSVGSRSLPLPKQAPQRIVVLADTGCRLKKADNAWQACDDGDSWPFPEIASTAAAMKPDLVLHIGDYHYRENACPADIAGCKDSPWGYGWDAWQADLFKPAAPLMAAAPWVMVRGNHEECARAGQGWFRFLDTQAADPKRSCNDPANDAAGNLSDPYAVAVGADTQVIVFDSAKAGRAALATSDPQFIAYQAQFQAVNRLAAKAGVNSIFTNHHPILGFAPIAGAPPAPGNQALQSVMQSVNPTAFYPSGVKTAIHGHVHDFQAINFSSAHPATFVSGNGGDNLDVNFADPFPANTNPAPGAIVDKISHTSSFGFMVMDRQSNGAWAYKAYTRKGLLLTTCLQTGSNISCDKTGYLAPN
ncbi:calcineurin-like phosphoesterase family protein [Collimonas sp. PA-H2]|uniref:metallophosphoesterase family protein n=1 Tax=Collimonas sp. PA-H2 TaxID=1881062 RepID=UPI000BF68021|nr:calcineurin-like phosphoesterase family protein [Collimonas sp. PA-H2]